MRLKNQQIHNIPKDLPQKHIESWSQEDWDALGENILNIARNLQRSDATAVATDDPNEEIIRGGDLYTTKVDGLIRYIKVHRAIFPLRPIFAQILAGVDNPDVNEVLVETFL